MTKGGKVQLEVRATTGGWGGRIRTRVLGRRTAPFHLVVFPARVLHGFVGEKQGPETGLVHAQVGTVNLMDPHFLPNLV